MPRYVHPSTLTMSATNQRAVQRGRLLERIAQQRLAVSANCAPIVSALEMADQVLDGAAKTRAWVEKNPLAVGAGLLVLVIWRPKGALGLAKKSLLSWRAWRLVRGLTRNLLA